MFNLGSQGSLSGGNGAGEALDNGDFGKQYFDQPEGSLLDGHGAGEAQDNGNDVSNYLQQVHPVQFGKSPDCAISNPKSINVEPPHQAGTMQFVPTPGLMNSQPPHQVHPVQFGKSPDCAISNPESINVEPPHQAGTMQFVPTPGLMNMQTPHQVHPVQFGESPDCAISNPESINVEPPHQAGTMQFVPTPNHTISNPGLMNMKPPHQGILQLGTTPNHAILKPGLMNVEPPQWVQQPGAINNVNPAISTQMNSFPLAEPGTSLSSNITNADAWRAARIRESKRKSWEKKKKERRETEELLAEATKRNSYLTEVNARLEKEGVEARTEQKNSKKKISDLEEEVSRLTNELQGQTVHLDELSKKLVATDDADENNLFKRKNELPTSSTNNPDIIKTDELQKENEMLKRKIKKLRIVNNALCDKLSKDEQ